MTDTVTQLPDSHVVALTPASAVRLSTHDVCNLVGITYRMLDFGIRAGYYECENDGQGYGSRRWFTLPQLRRVVLIAWLCSGGLTPSQSVALIDADTAGFLLAAFPGGA